MMHPADSWVCLLVHSEASQKDVCDLKGPLWLTSHNLGDSLGDLETNTIKLPSLSRAWDSPLSQHRRNGGRSLK